MEIRVNYQNAEKNSARVGEGDIPDMIYELLPVLEGENIASLDLRDSDFITLGLVGVRGGSLRSKWTNPPPSIEYITEGISADDLKNVLIPDIVRLGVDFCLRPHAYDALKDKLQPFVEFLPLQHPSENQTWYLMNCINQIDAIVPEKSRYEIEDDGTVGLIEQAHIDESRAKGQLLFCVNGFPGVYTHGKELSELLEKHDLYGITLEGYQQA